MKIIDFYNKLSELYPTSLSSEWDNDGLMCCRDGEAEIKRVLVALDATDASVEYAKKGGFDLLLTHHPMIFKGLRSLTPYDVVGRRVLKALGAGISVISLHTRLDAGEDGVNDTLAAALGLSDVLPFGDDSDPTLGRIGTTDVSDPSDFAKAIKKAVGVPFVTAYVSRPVSRVAVVGGGGGDFVSAAQKAGADTLVTGECGYNKALDSAEAGINVFVCGHYFTEAPVLSRLADLAVEITGAECEIFTEKPETVF